MVVDLSAPEDARMIATPGQSGNPLSAHSTDLLQRWRDFDYLAATLRSSLLDPTRYGAPARTPDLEGFLFPATYDLSAGAPVARPPGRRVGARQPGASTAAREGGVPS